MNHKIAILGPESTGKSLLCQRMSLHFDGVCVPEVARAYLKDIQLDYTYEDILQIAKKQKKSEELVAQSAHQKLIFFDTE